MAVVLAAVVAFAVATLPPSPRTTTAVDPALAERTVRGAFHVHTTRSDGSADKAGVAAAARRAGLNFVVLTDHGDGMRSADPPEYIDGVLCIDGVEISTNGGHYVAVGASPAPYPLGGESAAVVEDVARLGGFGVAAHPVSPRRELAWDDWSLPVNGVEWLNADSEWRDERRWKLARVLLAYPVRPAGALAALLDRPASALAQWDSAAAGRRILAIAGHDAHGGVGQRLEDAGNRWSVGVPSYVASFRTFSTRVVLDRPLTRDPAPDGSALLAMVRAGRFYTAIDAIAAGSTLEFTAQIAGETVEQGSVLHGAGMASFNARATVPEGASIAALRNGAVIARSPGGSLQFQAREMGAYRVEVLVDDAPGTPPVPWLVSNPIFRYEQTPEAEPVVQTDVVRLDSSAWRIEKDERSHGRVSIPAARPGGEVQFEYRLREDARASQFVALSTDLPQNLRPFDAITFNATSAAPQRLSVQLRFAGDPSARWGRSVYLDSTDRTIIVPIDDMRRADGPVARPDVRRATSLLFVVDLTNARPGDAGTIRLRDVRLVAVAGTRRSS